MQSQVIRKKLAPSETSKAHSTNRVIVPRTLQPQHSLKDKYSKKGGLAVIESRQAGIHSDNDSEGRLAGRKRMSNADNKLDDEDWPS